MAFTFTRISQNKVRFVCDALADAGTVQDALLNADPATLALLGGALPAAGATAAQVQTHLKVRVVRVGQAAPVDSIFGYAATLDNVDGGGLGIPTLHVRRAQTATGTNDGQVEGYITRIQSRNL